jgi:hypothetical protein
VAQPRSPGSAITPLSSHTDAPKAAIIPSGKVRDPAVPAAETAKCKSILRVEMAQFIGKCKHDALLSSVSPRRSPQLDQLLRRGRMLLWRQKPKLRALQREEQGCALGDLVGTWGRARPVSAARAS